MGPRAKALNAAATTVNLFVKDGSGGILSEEITRVHGIFLISTMSTSPARRLRATRSAEIRPSAAVHALP